MIRELVSPEEIAMIEHDVLSELNVLEMRQGEWQFYVAGVNDMARRIISMLADKDHDRETRKAMGVY